MSIRTKSQAHALSDAIRQVLPQTNHPLSSPNQKSATQPFSIYVLADTIKSAIENQLRLKKIIQRAQKIDLMSNIPPENKIDVKHSLFINIFLLINTVAYGMWKFTHKEYRNLKHISLYMIGLGYLGLAFGIFWEDQVFLNAISTKQDAYKSEIKYVLRKECLENVEDLGRIEHKREMFKRLNSQFEKFHSVYKNGKLVSLLP